MVRAENWNERKTTAEGEWAGRKGIRLLHWYIVACHVATDLRWQEISAKKIANLNSMLYASVLSSVWTFLQTNTSFRVEMQGQNDFSSYCRWMFERTRSRWAFGQIRNIFREPYYSLNKSCTFVHLSGICRKWRHTWHYRLQDTVKRLVFMQQNVKFHLKVALLS